MKPAKISWQNSLVIASCLIATWLIFSRLQLSFSRAGVWDFPIFTDFARQFLTTGHLYSQNLDAYGPASAVYKFPPLSGAILVMLLQYGITENQLIIVGATLQIASFFGGIFWLTFTLIPERRDIACALTLCLTAMLLPALEENLLRLQLETSLLLLLIAATIFTYKEKYRLAGFMIGIAFMLKIYPIMAMLFFLSGKKWQSATGLTLAVIACSIFSIFSIGIHEHKFYITEVLPILLQENPIADAENISIGRLLLLTNIKENYINNLLKLVVFFPTIIYYILLKKSSNIDDRFTNNQINVLIFSIFIPFTLLGMSNSFWNYQLLLALPLTILACSLANKNTGKKAVDYLTILAIALICFSLHITASMTVNEEFYPAELIVIIASLVTRFLLPIILIAAMLRHILLVIAQKNPQ
jgi:heme/copper-type cytochrome/quinol oxidase subunit 4